MNQAEIKAAFQKLPPLPNNRHYWTLKRAEVRERVLRGDDLQDFLGWSLISATFFVGNAPYIVRERDALIQSGKWERWNLDILTEMNGHSNTNLINQAYHLHKWEETTGKRISKLKTIIEIGGGYGAMARVIRAAGFVGEYIIYDLPEFSLLQQFYLGYFGVEATFKDNVAQRSRADLLIALWSLSEMPPSEREKYLAIIKARHNLIGAQYDFEDTDNNRYFKDSGMRQEHIDHLQGDFYLFS